METGMDITNKIAATVLSAALVFLLAGCGNSNLDKGNISLRLGDYPAAISFYSEEVKNHPDSYLGRLGLGKALLQKACDADTSAWKGALVQLEAARTLSPTAELGGLLAEVYLQRSHQLLNARDTVAALDALSSSIESDKAAIEPLNLAGIIYYRLGEADKSEVLFTKAVSLDSANASARFNLGMVYWQSGKLKQAHAQWLAALAASPRDKDMLYWFARAEKKLRETSP
jgi:tetratricopeptide (TPR) repeat protein